MELLLGVMFISLGVSLADPKCLGAMFSLVVLSGAGVNYGYTKECLVVQRKALRGL